MTRIGFIGLGSQGGPMARRIVDDGYALTIWARRPESLAAFNDTPAVVAATPRELGALSDVVGICVVADADVQEVLRGADGVLAGMAPGGIVAIHSTIHPDTCRRIAVEAAVRDLAIVDAPVSGGGHVAAQRKLLVMAGGDDRDVARCRPIFETYGDPVIHLGPLGSGQMAKLFNNLIFTAQLCLATEAFSFADRLKIDRTAIAQVLANGTGGTRAAAILAASGFDLSGIRGAVSLLRKDVGIILDVAHSDGAAEPAELVALAERSLTSLEAAAPEPNRS